jgi:hypothetical protein
MMLLTETNRQLSVNSPDNVSVSITLAIPVISGARAAGLVHVAQHLSYFGARAAGLVHVAQHMSYFGARAAGLANVA